MEVDIREDIKELGPAKNAPVSTVMGIAAIALQMAMKYHDMNLCKDAALYQQYKLEGRNMREMHIDVVFETAMQIEVYLLTREKAIAKMIGDAMFDVVNELEPGPEEGEEQAE